MNGVRVAGRLVAAHDDSRVLDYLLLAYGEEGRTSLGRVTVDPDVLGVPDRIVANLEHEPSVPVAWGTVEDVRGSTDPERPDGLYASFPIPETTVGNDHLIAAREGLRPGISVELADPVIRGGRLVAGTLDEAGFVRRPAFASSRLLAADYGELVETDTTRTTTHDDGTVVTEHTETATEYTITDPEPEDPEGDNETLEDPDMGNTLTAAAPRGGQAARLAGRGTPAAPNRNKAEKLDRVSVFKLLAGAYREGGERKLLAALSDIVPANTVAMEQPQWVDELWSGRGYERRIIPLFNHADLTSFTVRGWRWLVKPQVAPYAGNKTDVPSNAVSTEQQDIPAERIAGAHDIDRKHRDFNDAEFFAAYFAAMTESYAQVSDGLVADDVITAAPYVAPGAAVPDVPPGLVYVVDGALAVLDATRTAPTFALVATDLWRSILLTPKDKTLEYLSSSLGLETGDLSGFRLVPAPELDAGSVLVGSRAAVTVHELGGPTPIRVEAENIAKGGVDAGVFGYYAVNVHDEDGLALVAATDPRA